MEFRTLIKEDCEKVRLWRNDTMHALRTPFMLTQEMQEDFYKNTVCNRDAKARFWGIWIEQEVKPIAVDNLGTGDPPVATIETTKVFIGIVGLENIEWENGRAEISMIIGPDYRGKGYGKQVVGMLLKQGFHNMGLRQIWGEYYTMDKHIVKFWGEVCKKYNAHTAVHKHVKRWEGAYYSSMYFSIEREGNK